MITLAPAVANVVVPIPRDDRKYEFKVVDDAMSEETVKLLLDVAMSDNPSDDEVMIELDAKDVEFVPPFAIGRVPVTFAVRETCPVKFESVRQEPEIEKQPVVTLKPTLEVEVARPEIFRPRSVVVPVEEISSALIDDVA